jgi:hypothetical protein
MKTIVLTVNVRKAFGDPAEEKIVGIYQVNNKGEAAFRTAADKAVTRLNRGAWILPKDRPAAIQQKLSEIGYVPIESAVVFAPLF